MPSRSFRRAAQASASNRSTEECSSVLQHTTCKTDLGKLVRLLRRNSQNLEEGFDNTDHCDSCYERVVGHIGVMSEGAANVEGVTVDFYR